MHEINLIPMSREYREFHANTSLLYMMRCILRSRLWEMLDGSLADSSPLNIICCWNILKLAWMALRRDILERLQPMQYLCVRIVLRGRAGRRLFGTRNKSCTATMPSQLICEMLKICIFFTSGIAELKI